MIIKNEMPFDFCEKCPEFIMDVDETTLFENGGIATRAITVSCKNRWLCTQISERMRLENEAKNSLRENV